MNKKAILPVVDAVRPASAASDWWRTLEELAGGEEFTAYVQREFPLNPELPAHSTRRDFMRLMAASLLLAGATGCDIRQPREKIVPAARLDRFGIPGIPTYFTTAMEFAGCAVGLTVETRDGRPIKVEGNPLHPASLGSTGVFHQAATLDLYDPDRLRTPAYRGDLSTLKRTRQMLSTLAAECDRDEGAGLSIVIGTTTSPTVKRLFDQVIARWPKATWSAVDASGPRTESVPVYDFSKADCVLSVGADFLSARDWPPCYVRQFADARRIVGATDAREMIRLYSMSSAPSLTSAKADHALSVSPSKIAMVLCELAKNLKIACQTTDWNLAPRHWIDSASKDLQDAGARTLVVVDRRMPAEVHELASAINDHLGATGNTVRWIQSPIVQSGSPPAARRNMVVLGDEPMQIAAVQAAVKRAERSVILSQRGGEVAKHATWVIPESHFMETWSDARAHDGTPSIGQPLIAPLYESMSAIEVLGRLAIRTESGYEAVRATWRMDEQQWERSLADGVIEEYEKVGSSQFSSQAMPKKEQAAPKDQVALTKLFELNFQPDPNIWDGRFANNGWLQELPKPLTHVVWDNPAWIAPADAVAMNVSHGDVVQVSAGDRAIEIPIWIVPGHAEGCVTLFRGYGQAEPGRIGAGVGFDVRPLLGMQHATVAKTGRHQRVVTTQHHQMMEGRHLARSGTLSEYLRQPDHPEFAHPPSPGPQASVYPPWKYDGHKWGMTIDLTACVGCSACVIACQSENNIPVVGKEQCDMNRHMHWIRIDTYYQGTPESPTRTLHQPVPCMHCEHAPCEVVCPVAATNHNDEGLNQMVYNRCIGTRYCSNNCPYKVRRFNFHDYANDFIDTPVMQLLSNPEVSLRSRGVMEKCTYCIERIQKARIAAEIDGESIRDGDIRTACQSVCPSRAIRFGDLNDPDSEVAIAAEHSLNYGLLEELNTKPRTTYLAEVRNENPVLGRT